MLLMALFSSIINAGDRPKNARCRYIPIKTAGHNFIGLESHFIESISDELDNMMVTGRAGVNLNILAKTSQIASRWLRHRPYQRQTAVMMTIGYSSADRQRDKRDNKSCRQESQYYYGQ